MSEQMTILLAVLCIGSFIFDAVIGKYYVISMISYSFYFVLFVAMYTNNIILPDVNMMALILIFGFTLILYIIYTVYKLIKIIINFSTKEKKGDETALWRKLE